MHPVYIPSRHRPDCKAAAMLTAARIEFEIVVEPHDFVSYSKKWGNLLKLPGDGKGIGFARNWIKQTALSRGESFHWQIDDDIAGFLLRVRGLPSERISAWDAMRRVEIILDKYQNVGIAGFNQNSWPPKPVQLLWNDLPVQAVLINTNSEAHYRSDLPLFSDFDFVIQTLKSGLTSVMFDDLRTVCPNDHQAAGGLKEVYAGSKRQLALERLKDIHPDLQVVEKDGKTKMFKRKLLKKYAVKPEPCSA